MPSKRKTIEIETAKLPRKRPARRSGSHAIKKPWEPSARQWAMYEAVTRGGSYRVVGAAFGVTRNAVFVTCSKVDEILSQQYMDKIRRLRARHTQQLEAIVEQSLTAWEKSKAIGVTETTESEGVTQQDGSTIGTGVTKKKRQERHQCGDVSYLSEARAALADIRKIWAVDKNPKVAEMEGEEEYRVAGKPREQVIEEAIVRLQTSLTISRSRTTIEE